MDPRPDNDTAAFRASVLRATSSALVILGVYAVVPVSSAQDTTSVRQILQDPRPSLRAAEVLALVVPLSIAVFAWAYLLLSAADPGAFSEPLNRIDAA